MKRTVAGVGLENAIKKVATYNKIITRNSELFAPDTRITEKQFCKLVGLEIPQRGTHYEFASFNFKKLQKYTELNKLLARRGVYIKQRFYGAFYDILPRDNTDKKVKYYKIKSGHMQRASTILKTGRERYDSIWKRLSIKEVREVATYIGTDFQEAFVG